MQARTRSKDTVLTRPEGGRDTAATTAASSILRPAAASRAATMEASSRRVLLIGVVFHLLYAASIFDIVCATRNRRMAATPC